MLSANDHRPGERGFGSLWAAALLLIGLPLFVLSQLHLTGDIFVLKGGRFLSDAAFASTLLARISAYGGLLLAPLVLKFWRAQCAVRFGALPMMLVALGSIAAAFPWQFINLAGPLPPVRLILEHCLRHGFTAPLSFLAVASGLSWIVRPSGSARTTMLWCVGLYVGAICLQPLWRGFAIPRLEDEVAYHVQALIFRSGHIRGTMVLPDFARLVSPPALFPVTWVDFSGPNFWSAHFHGWSGVLAGLALLDLDSVGASLFALISLFLFYRLAGTLFPGTYSVGLVSSLGLFVSVRLIPALAHTYMAHMLSLALSLACCLAWLHLGVEQSVRTRWLAVVALICVAGLYALTRLQTLAALLCAFLLADLVVWRSPGPGAKVRWARMAVVLAAGGSAWAASVGYEIFSRTRYVAVPCQSLGFGPGHGCFPTYGTMGHSFSKTILNALDGLGRWNEEASPGGLPLLLIVVPLLLPVFFRLGRGLRMLLLLGGGHSLLFALYFHNGGESYRGRYLSEMTFVLPLLAGAILSAKSSPGGSDSLPQSRKSSEWVLAIYRILPFIVGLSVLSAVVLNIRMDYFNPYIESVRSLSPAGSHPVRSALIVVPHHPQVAPPEGLAYPDEFERLRAVPFRQSEISRYINTGMSPAAATGKRLGPDGFLRDGNNNVLIGPIEGADVARWLQHFGLGRAYRLRYRSARASGTGGRRWTPWETARIELQPISVGRAPGE